MKCQIYYRVDLVCLGLLQVFTVNNAIYTIGTQSLNELSATKISWNGFSNSPGHSLVRAKDCIIVSVHEWPILWLTFDDLGFVIIISV